MQDLVAEVTESQWSAMRPASVRTKSSTSLVAHGTVEGYALTAWGESLLMAMRPLVKWSADWHAATEG